MRQLGFDLFKSEELVENLKKNERILYDSVNNSFAYKVSKISGTTKKIENLIFVSIRITSEANRICLI